MDLVSQAAATIDGADALVVAAGAGIGVDSGLPDFRGNEGFWRAYPPYRHLDVSFVDMANPAGFHRDPERAWGFYGHRRALYRRTTPHPGFAVLRHWCEQAPDGGFVFTSNIDGQFQAAGFDPDAIVECHGTLHREQCIGECGQPPWQAGDEVAVDETTMRAVPPLPACPGCGGLARPNVLMFGDWGWDPVLHDAQQRRLEEWLSWAGGGRLAVVEVGAGSAVPTVRRFSETLVHRLGASLVRINPREPGVPAGQIGIAAGAKDVLLAIDARRGEARHRSS